MTDITYKVKGIKHSENLECSVVVKQSAELYFSLMAKQKELSLIYSNLKASLPSHHMYDREALEFLAACQREIAKLKQHPHNLTQKIVNCLYVHIKSFTEIAENIQKLKERAAKALKSMELSRSQVKIPIGKSVCADLPEEEEFREKNQQILTELKKSDQLIESTHEAAFQLSAMLKVFHQKVTEQEVMSFSILKDAETSVSHMKTANLHLDSANERSKGMEKIWVAYFLTLTLILLGYDWWTSRVVYTA